MPETTPVPWFAKSAAFGLAVAAAMAVSLVVPWPWQLVPAAGLVGFVLAIRHNPERRFFRLITTVLALWGAILFRPVLRLHLEGTSFGTALAEFGDVGTEVNWILGFIVVCLIAADLLLGRPNEARKQRAITKNRLERTRIVMDFVYRCTRNALAGLVILVAVLFLPERPDDRESHAQPFEILSATVFIRFEDDYAADSPQRKLSNRSTLVVRANERIEKGERILLKELTTTHADGLGRWQGVADVVPYSDSDTNHGGWVNAPRDLEAGDVANFVFGGEVRYDLPLADGRDAGGIRVLRDNEACWSYPNKFQVPIRNVTICIESPTSAIALSPDPVRKDTAEGDVSRNGVRHGPADAEPNSGCLWATWRDVQPGEHPWLFFEIDGPMKPPVHEISLFGGTVSNR